MAASNDKSAKASNEPTEATKARRSGDPSKRAAAEGAPAKRSTKDKPKTQRIGNPQWFVPVMLGLMLVGLIWVVTFYITQEQYPIESWGRWNLGAGFALMMAGFAMTTRWK